MLNCTASSKMISPKMLVFVPGATYGVREQVFCLPTPETRCSGHSKRKRMWRRRRPAATQKTGYCGLDGSTLDMLPVEVKKSNRIS